jgi:hypothetical protein
VPSCGGCFSGRIPAPNAFMVLIFVGIFHKQIPQGCPIGCTFVADNLCNLCLMAVTMCLLLQSRCSSAIEDQKVLLVWMNFDRLWLSIVCEESRSLNCSYGCSSFTLYSENASEKKRGGPINFICSGATAVYCSLLAKCLRGKSEE